MCYGQNSVQFYKNIFFVAQFFKGFNLVFFRASGEDVRLMLWDTAGQEEFDAITKAYYRGTQYLVNFVNFRLIFVHFRCPSLRYCILHHRSRIFWGRQKVEEKSGGWMWTCANGSGPEQNWLVAWISSWQVSKFSVWFFIFLYFLWPFCPPFYYLEVDR